MKKIAKLSLTALGLGLIFISFSQLRRKYHDRTENHILKLMLNRYQGCPVKGTWIQHRGNHYICEITVKTNHQWQHHQFRTNSSGNLMLNE